MNQNIFNEYPDVITIQDIQKLLRISRHAAYELIHSGQIPSRKIGRIYRILKTDLIRFLRSNSV